MLSGYIGLLGFEVGGDFGMLPLPLLAFGTSAADTPIRPAAAGQFDQCDQWKRNGARSEG